MQQESAFTIRSRAIAQRFLQTVVVVDDQPDYRHGRLQEPPTSVQAPPSVLDAIPRRTNDQGQTHADGDEANGEALPVTLMPPEAVEPNTTDEDSSAAAHDVDAKTLIDAFASEGLVCGLLSPQKGDGDVISKTVKVAHRADIVVLDWYLLGNNSSTALSIFANIIKEDVGRRLRLISIYTGQPDLYKVVADAKDSLIGTLSSTDRGYELKAINPFTIQAGPIRVSVHAKPNAPIPQGNKELRARVVSESALPKRLIAEFTEMTAGLVSNVALHSLCELRERTHELLGRLNSFLDAPFLSHRALLPHPEEAGDHVAAIVASEIAELLSAAHTGDMAGTEATREWVAGKPGQGWQLPVSGSTKTKMTSEQVLDLLSVGIDNWPALQVILAKLDDEPRRKKEIAQLHRRLTEMFCIPNEARALDFEFARLTSMSVSRPKHGVSSGQPPPVLRLGTVLEKPGSSSTKESFWLCLQPLCDSVIRTKDPRRRFPLIPLDKVDGSKAFRIVAVNLDNKDVRLMPILKPYELDNVWFQVNSEHGVVRATYKDGEYCFISEKDGDYSWLGTLKQEQAQRIANEFSSKMCRVGLDESEWLRRSARED